MGLVSTQKSEVIDKIRNQINRINKLTDSRYYSIIGERITELKIMLKKLEALQHKLETNTFVVSIVGLEKTGKSTFANAFMGIDILPTKDARCTYTATNICYGNEDRAEVKFFTSKEFNNNFFERINSFGVDINNTPNDWFQWNINMLEGMYANVASHNSDIDNIKNDLIEILENKDSIKGLLDRPAADFIDESLEFEIKDYIASPSKALAVKEIIIHSSKLSEMKNAQLYDVPGFDSPTQIHKEQTRQWMKRSDAIILVLNASAPSFNESIVRFFHSMDTDDDDISIGEKLFVFGNKADMAATPKENADKIKDELKKYRIMPDEFISSRSVIGSAKSHIDIEKAIEKADDIEANRLLQELNAKGIESDGIGDIRDLLITYNNTVRLNVMYRRVNNIQQRVFDLLNSIKEENSLQDSSSVDIEMENLVDELKRNAKTNINVEISAYESAVKVKYKAEKPITDKIRETVINKIDPYDYSVTDEEINTQNSQYLVTSDIRRAESDVRQAKYKKMYDVFIDRVVHLAVDEYSDSEAALVDAFERGLGIGKTNPYYDTLHSLIREYIVGICSNTTPEGYYSSLIRRYSGNLFEVLVSCPFSDDIRFDKFIEEKKNFYSLSLFGNSSEDITDPARCPMHYQMLFHERLYDKTDDENSISKQLIILAEKRICELIPAQTELYDLICDFSQSHRENAASEFTALLEKLPPAPQEDEKCIPLFAIAPNPSRDQLITLLKESRAYDSTLYSSAFSKEKYREFFKSYEKDLSKIKEEFIIDIEILKTILSDQVLNATAIEIPFLDLVHQNVTSIKESLERADFTSFINRNKEHILDEKYKRLKTEHERKTMQAEMIREIESIVKESE